MQRCVATYSSWKLVVSEFVLDWKTHYHRRKNRCGHAGPGRLWLWHNRPARKKRGEGKTMMPREGMLFRKRFDGIAVRRQDLVFIYTFAFLGLA